MLTFVKKLVIEKKIERLPQWKKFSLKITVEFTEFTELIIFKFY